MTQQAFTFQFHRPDFLTFVRGEESASGLAELHFKDADGSPHFIILPVKAQHELLNALLWERRYDIARPEAIQAMEASEQ